MFVTGFKLMIAANQPNEVHAVYMHLFFKIDNIISLIIVGFYDDYDSGSYI